MKIFLHTQRRIQIEKNGGGGWIVMFYLFILWGGEVGGIDGSGGNAEGKGKHRWRMRLARYSWMGDHLGIVSCWLSNLELMWVEL